MLRRLFFASALLLLLSACRLLPEPGVPQVTSVAPAAGATNVALNTAVRAALALPDGALNLTTLDETNVSLTNLSSGEGVSAARTLSDDGNTLIVRPAQTLAENTSYRFSVTEGLQTEMGTPFTPFESTFTTGTTQEPEPDLDLQTDVSRVLFTAGGETSSDTRPLTLINGGDTPVEVSNLSITGEDAARFALEGAPSLPLTLSPGASETLELGFSPNGAGPRQATLTVSSNDAQNPTLEVPLGGLGVRGQGGNQEPSLQWIFDTYGLDIDTGDTSPDDTFLVTEPTNELLGDEVLLQRLVKAGAGPVTVEVIGVFGVPNDPVLEFGWYAAGDTGSREALFDVQQTPSLNAQRLAPELDTELLDANGRVSFDPGEAPFGFYSFWPSNRFFNQRYVYTEDRLNTFEGAIPRQVRAYPLVEGGAVVPNAYVLATEEFSQGFDYNDVVFIVRNVAPSSSSEVDSLQVRNALGMPFDNRLVLHNIRDKTGNLCNPEVNPLCDPEAQPWLELETRNTGIVELENTGAQPLQVSLSLSAPNEFVLPNGESFLTLPPNSTYELTVEFSPVGQSGKAVLQSALIVQAGTDSTELELAGIFQPQPEGSREVFLDGLVTEAFGYPIDLGANNQGGLSSADPNSPPAGDEVRSAFWEAANPNAPVIVTQIAAFHSCCNASYLFEMFYQGQSTSFASFRNDRVNGQTIYPRVQGGDEIASLRTNANQPFEMRSANYSTNPSVGRGNGNLGLRLWPAKDRNGQVIANSYVAAQDFVEEGCGTTEMANCDYNDNMYFIENITPAN